MYVFLLFVYFNRRCVSTSEPHKNAADGSLPQEKVDSSLETESSLRKETAQADNLMDIGTRKIYTEEHDMFRRSVRKFFQEEVAPNHAE
jgi:hypothetical protein